jgi:hypothetical protein
MAQQESNIRHLPTRLCACAHALQGWNVFTLSRIAAHQLNASKSAHRASANQGCLKAFVDKIQQTAILQDVHIS